MPKGKRGAKKAKPVGFRPEKELRAELEAAHQATGSDLTELVKECVRWNLPAVVAKILERRNKAAEPFLRQQEKIPKAHKGQ